MCSVEKIVTIEEACEHQNYLIYITDPLGINEQKISCVQHLIVWAEFCHGVKFQLVFVDLTTVSACFEKNIGIFNSIDQLNTRVAANECARFYQKNPIVCLAPHNFFL